MSQPPPSRRDRAATAHWRSLDGMRRAGGLRVLEEGKASPEFPDGCDLPPDAVTRREMLGLMSASLGLAGLTACRRPVEHIVPYVDAPEGIVPGIPQRYATTMPLGTSALGLVVESHEGRPTKIEGNELHPASRGGAGAWAQAAILGLYDPDRSARPRRRQAAAAVDGAAGGGDAGAADGAAANGHATPNGHAGASGQGAAVAAPAGDSTWADFTTFWNETAAAAGDGAGLAFLTGGYSSPTRARLSRALRERFPSARWAAWDPLHDGNAFAGIAEATGTAQRPLYRLERARAVLALDCDLLGTESEAVANARGWAAGRRAAAALGNGHGGHGANGHGANGLGGSAAAANGAADAAHGENAGGDAAMANGAAVDAAPGENGHGAVAHTAAAAAGAAAADGPNRLYAVESTMTLTGAAADHRVRLPSRLAGAFLAAVASELGVGAGDAGNAAELPAPARARAAAIARDLAAERGAAVVAVGRNQPPAVHALGHRINRSLGAVGGPLELQPLDDAEWGSARAVVELAEAMRAGEVSTLVILGANPVYDAPADAAFAGAMAAVAHTVHLGEREDETARLCEWRLPESHFLEAWGDARSADGTVSVIQPLIAPLYDSKSAVEVLAMLAGAPQAGHELVRATWADRFGVGDESAWRRVLHDGLLGAEPAGGADGGGHREASLYAAADGGEAEIAGHRETSRTAADGASADGAAAGGSADAGEVPVAAVAAGSAASGEPAPAAEPASSEPAANPSAAGNGLEVTFPASISVFDGRFANLAWLLELPDPITKLTWDNAALVSPATARELGVETGDVLAIEAGGRSIEATAFVLPGQADGSIALPLGWGRTGAGRVGDGRGFSAYPLRTSAAPGFVPATVTPAGRRHPLSVTQEHWTLDEPITGIRRPLIRERTVAEFRENPHPEHGHHPESKLIPEHAYDVSPQWAMVIDLNACTGCSACVVACQAENNIPVVGKEQVAKNREMHWLRVDRYFTGDPDDPGAAAAEPGVAFQPMPCQQCENAPCEQVCPVAATVHDAEGLNAMVYNRCIGTRYCSNNCPYKVRRFNFFNYTKDTPELVKMAMNPDVTVRSRGVMEKCTYCVQRISEAKIAAKRASRPLADGDVRTACQQTCPTQAITFGDFLLEGSRVAAERSDPRNYTLLDELHNLPRTSYQTRLRNPSPAWEEA